MGQPKRTIAEIVILKPTAAENEAVKAAIEAATTVGEKLAGARTARGLTLQDAHLATKVKVAQLAAIEAGDRSSLPAVPFTAGFIKAYAQYLGLDPDEYARAYRVEVGAAPKPESPPAELTAPSPPAIATHVAETPTAAVMSSIAAAPAPAVAEVKTNSMVVIEPTPQFVASPLPAPIAAPAPDRFALYVGAAAVAICVAWMSFNTMKVNEPAPAVVADVETNSAVGEIATAPESAPDESPTRAADLTEPATTEAVVEEIAVVEEPKIIAIAPPVVKPRPKPRRVDEVTPAPVMIAPEPEAPATGPIEETIIAAPEPVIVAATLSRSAAPKYPDRCARGAKEEERVSVVFDITVEGWPTNINAADSSNACFNGAAIDAASRMRFTPRTSDGAPVMEFGKRMTVRFPR
jgi:TonB family protein